MHCCLLETGWPRPLPTGPTHSTEEGAGYHCSIVSSTYHYISYFALRYLIWSSFQNLMLTCNLFQHTCFSCLKSTFFILSYQLHCCWLDDPHRFPGPTHSTRGRGVDVMTMTMAGGVGGGPGTWNIYLVHQGPSRVPLPDMLACLGARGYKYIRVGNWKIRVYFFSDVFVMFFETCTNMSAKSNHGSLEPSNRRHSDEINLGWIVRYVNSEVTPKGSWLKGIHPAFYGHLRDW